MQAQQTPLSGRRRKQTREVSRKHGAILVRTLRRTYGQHFAQGRPDGETLDRVLHDLDETSLTQLVHDHQGGLLDDKIEAARRN